MCEQQTAYLKAVLQAAQAEASEWRLDSIQMWDPTPLAVDLLGKTGVEYRLVQRETTSIASLMWYADGGDMPLWLNNEHYAWQ